MAQVRDDQIRWFRLKRSGLVEPFATPEETAKALVGVQAQILPAALIALWNRSASGADTMAMLTERLFVQRTLLRLWGQRHTLHLYATEDWPMIQAAFAERKTWWERQADAGADMDLRAFRLGIKRAAKLLRQRGTLSRKELRAARLELPAPLYSPWGGVFAELVRIGEACHAQWAGGEARYAHREHWLPDLEWKPPTTHAANVALARRFFATYGPATFADFSYWRAGARVGEARAAFSDIEQELITIETDGPAGAAAKAQYIRREDLNELHAEPPERDAWPVRLLGRFDPLLLGHRSKEWLVPKKFYTRIWRPAGHIEGVVWEHGRAVATWRYDRLGAQTLAIRVFPFRGPLPRHVGKAIRSRAREIARFFGLKPVPVRIERAAAPTNKP